jgi:hypothetical protein
MKMNYLYMVPAALVFASCTSSIPIKQTDTPGEYVVVARNMAGPFSSLSSAQAEAVRAATEFCDSKGLPFEESYVIDRPMAVAQAPESTLYFHCGEKPKASSADNASVEQRLVQLKNLRDRGLITEEEYATARQEILDSL